MRPVFLRAASVCEYYIPFLPARLVKKISFGVAFFVSTPIRAQQLFIPNVAVVFECPGINKIALGLGLSVFEESLNAQSAVSPPSLHGRAANAVRLAVQAPLSFNQLSIFPFLKSRAIFAMFHKPIFIKGPPLDN
jgi:hypothetical protein